MSDEILSEVIELLYGPGSELISKMNPDGADLHGAAANTHAQRKDRQKRVVTAGLSAVGAGAGAAGLGFGGHKLHQAYREARKIGGSSRVKAIKTAVGHEKLGTALIPLEVAGLGGEVMATRILHGDTKKKKGALVQKSLGDSILNNSTEVPSKHSLTRAMLKSSNRKKAIEYTRKGGGALRKLPNPITTTNEVEKNLDEIDVVWDAEISKADADKQQIFGWASVVEVNGEPIVDLQGDQISIDEMEKAGYEYVMKSRKGGDMHLRNNWEPIQKSEMIESFIVTPEKRDAMGLPDSVPSGWWVGFKVQDPNVWDMVKSGERTGFSIHGHGRRSP
jgi:hypothetical protein